MGGSIDDGDKRELDNMSHLSDTSGDVANDVPDDIPADIPEDAPVSGDDNLPREASPDIPEDIPEDVSDSETETLREVDEKPVDDNPFKEDGTLKENIRYHAGEFGYEYETDDKGRIDDFHADKLQLTAREDRLPHDGDTPGKLEGDQAGHLAGDRFGGSPEIDNLVSQSSHVNLSEYKKIENQWAKALENGQHVSANVDVEYEQGDRRPSAFDVDYDIDGEAFSQRILNGENR